MFVQLAVLMAVPELSRLAIGGAWLAETAITLATLVTVSIMPMRDPWMDDHGIAVPFATPDNRHRSPEDNFSLWNWMTVAWMAPLISVACKRQLDPTDVWLLPYQFQHERLHRLFREIKGSVTLRIFKANGPDLLISIGLGILESATNLLPILFLKELLAALEHEEPKVRVAVIYAVLTLAANLIGAQSGVFSIWFTRRCYERSRGEMITMIYEKTLRRKAFSVPGRTNKAAEDGGKDDTNKDDHQAGGPALDPASTGKILNLMRNDVYEVAQRFWEFPSLVVKPLNFVLSLILVWHLLGPASLLGILVLILAQAFNGLVVRILVSWETKRRSVTDLKLQVTTQFIETIRHLRWYDWQEKWLDEILTQRQKELYYRVVTALLGKAISVVNLLAAAFFPVAAFYAYTVLGGKPLTVDIAFPYVFLSRLRVPEF
jgi:ABC-type multidrug transport system fused ATPase/permease subunit